MQPISNLFFMFVGIVFLLLAKVKASLRGYSTPKTFSTDEWARCANYDVTVVDKWLHHLSNYEVKAFVANKNICELGPGSDLGTGLYLLSKGAAQYVAVDVNDMVSHAPQEIYEALLVAIGNRGGCDLDSLRRELRLAQGGTGQRLKFVCNPNFNIASEVAEDSIDLVFSQAAFEHFDDFDRFVRDLDFVAKPGAILVAEVDLQTHSRWIRERDPLNIYRYSDSLYRLLKCSGSPNRVRPYQYRDALERCGWTNVQTVPLNILDKVRFARAKGSLARQFRDDRNEMDQLSIVLCATKGHGFGAMVQAE